MNKLWNKFVTNFYKIMMSSVVLLAVIVFWPEITSESGIKLSIGFVAAACLLGLGKCVDDFEKTKYSTSNRTSDLDKMDGRY